MVVKNCKTKHLSEIYRTEFYNDLNEFLFFHVPKWKAIKGCAALRDIRSFLPAQSALQYVAYSFLPYFIFYYYSQSVFYLYYSILLNIIYCKYYKPVPIYFIECKLLQRDSCFHYPFHYISHYLSHYLSRHPCFHYLRGTLATQKTIRSKISFFSKNNRLKNEKYHPNTINLK
jgi:hypothetical protein